jgi:2-keto-4-pentenoate hydratase/2-oxohepta-3-ene-1,7-dioic acid hydratase in catechol pathway
MRVASIAVDGAPTIGIVNDAGRLVPVENIDPALPRSLRGLLALRDAPWTSLVAGTAGHEGVEPDAVTFLPLIPDPHAVWCATLNYATHVEEGNWDKPEYAGWFLRAANSLVGHEAPMVKPRISDRFDYEGELAVVIGKPGHNIDPADAPDHIAGYTCFNDGSIRDWQRHSTQITVGKNFTATGGFGPYLVTPDEVPDIMNARLVTRLNGTVMQDAHISDMTTPVNELVAYLSKVGELRIGDVIVTGTPGGVGARKTPPVFMAVGDVIEVEIDGLGTLRNPICEEAS